MWRFMEQVSSAIIMLGVIVIIIVVKLHHELCLQHKDEVFVTSNQEGINKVLKKQN